MATLIDDTFFVGDNAVPNTGNSWSLEELNLYIGSYEPKCLRSLLGYPLYKAIQTETSQRITDLLDGVEYESLSTGATEKWDGLLDSVKKDSLIADYVYFHFLCGTATKKTGVNTGVPKGNSIVPYSPIERQVTSWNNFSSKVAKLIDFLLSNSLEYPEFNPYQAQFAKQMSRKINALGI